MVISEIIIAVLLGVLVIVSAIYLTYFLWNNFKLAKQRAENGDGFEEDNKKSKVLSIILVAYLALAASIFAINLYYRSSPLVKNQYYVSIKTDSMSQALKENYYLDNNKLTNQIAQYDIAVFDKTTENNIEKYDIILFKKDNILIAHRVVEISDDGLFYTQGDKNPERDDFTVSYSEVLGKYNHSLKFLSFVNYIGYTPGFYVTMVGVTYDIGVILYFEFKRSKLRKNNENLEK